MIYVSSTYTYLDSNAHIYIHVCVCVYIYMYRYRVLSNHTNKADRNVRTEILVKFPVDHHASLVA